MTVPVGVLPPAREAAMTGRWDPAPLLALAGLVERSGYDSLWDGDSLAARPPRPCPVLLVCPDPAPGIATIPPPPPHPPHHH
ncbi:hypothetical protein [Streptantibioticus ferralitis]|uniref:LLM class flavin-dependent oxidoreductase n=1 Tax=Streptantibioticus ferralitis TaxID=236510 RepID=A0ABT5Z9S7_9ACTN|nr:hypothetical protein [Streptantibioticus ferralitis]MDF2259815.1 hypothetical protein [Streptantibioticus ferralitis]